jgi:hypothetical protein
MKTTIKDLTEETSCSECGYPLYVGDSVTWNKDEQPFCSKGCERAYERSEEFEGGPDESYRN